MTTTPHAQPIEDLLLEYGVNHQKGLSHEEANLRLKKYGPNLLNVEKPFSLWQLFLHQLNNVIVFLLVAAALASFYFGDIQDALAIILVIVINTAIGFTLEWQANKSVLALKLLDKKFSKVVRNDNLQLIETALLVPGDIMFVEAGDVAGADGRIIKSAQVQMNESLLTGESLPISKNTLILPANTIMADRRNMIYKSTAIVNGNAHVLVTATGEQTEIGQISTMVAVAQKEEVPLNKKLNAFSRKLIGITVVILVLFIGIGYLANKDIYVVLQTAIALAVAAIPEGLPIVATIALASGMLKMAKKQVLVKNLTVVETLGETDMILTDKTGTLTENKLIVQQLSLSVHQPVLDSNTTPESQSLSLNLEKLIQVAVLCNNARINENNQEVGDPLEVALLNFANRINPVSIKLNEKWPRVFEKSFDSESRIMITGHETVNGNFMAMKGSPVEVLAQCSFELEDDKTFALNEKQCNIWLKRASEMATAGLKVLGFAFKETSSIDTSHNFIFIGLVAFVDPPRSEVPMALKLCKEAGITVVMVTGDHADTARYISYKVGLVDDQKAMVCEGTTLSEMDLTVPNAELNQCHIYARISPAQKLQLMHYYQQRGHIVAMTGDGVNDAPALKKASVGIAMGKKGTEVAREAADMVLLNDSFASIVAAIKQGRTIFYNIKNFVIYLLSCNLSEILIIGIAAFSNLPLPLLPLQILFLNLITDVFPALALGMSSGQANIMQGSFKDKTRHLMNNDDWRIVFYYAAVLTISVLGVYFLSIITLGYNTQSANTLAFYSLAFTQLAHPFNLIKSKDSWWNNEIVKNKFLWWAIAFCAFIMLIIYWIPPLANALSIATINPQGLILIVAASLFPILVVRITKRFVDF